MTTTGSTSGVTVPQSAVVVGAGIVGLSTAWHLLRLGVDVVVIDRDDIAAGSSWGNAGFLTPDIATPLPEPAVLRYGLKALVSPRSPLYVPIGFDPQLWNFLLRFARSEEHTSELQSRFDLVCRLLLEKKKQNAY